MAKAKIEKLVPDTSVIVEGVLSKKLRDRTLAVGTVIIHEALLSELESQARQNKISGFAGLEEINAILGISKALQFHLQYSGKREGARSVDAMVRDLAYEEGATLITSDAVQAMASQAKNIPVIFEMISRDKKPVVLERFFDQNTMSIHLRENMPPQAKMGAPGRWLLVNISDKKVEKQEIIDMAKELVEQAGTRDDSFLEIEREGSTILQIGDYRIVITRPPFSDAWEITAVRPIAKLDLKDYSMPEKFKQRLSEQVSGVLIAGAPGMGKSTFSQAVAEHFASQNKIVKTVEAPRDLQVSDNITQYAISHGSSEEIHDILLLSRPDYTLFDEMRNTEDFRLFADLRLSGVGMIGVVHATTPIDAIQRFIGRLELGVIPHVIDTVVFIKDGVIDKIFSLSMKVKVPSGMNEADLARPVIIIEDYETGELEFELYSYGEETVVVPVSDSGQSATEALAAREIKRKLQKYSEFIEVSRIANNRALVLVPEKDISAIIGKQGVNIAKIEEELGIHIDVRPLAGEKQQKSLEEVAYTIELRGKSITFTFEKEHSNRIIDIYINGKLLASASASKKNDLRFKRENKLGKALMDAYNNKDKIKLFVTKE